MPVVIGKIKEQKAFEKKELFAAIGIIEIGAIAQLGERLNGIQEVSGSIPLSSTYKKRNVLFSYHSKNTNGENFLI